MKEFFGQRVALYGMRKQYMLARLQKEYEILVNKVKFIQGVIAEGLKINRVKRKALIRAMVDFGLKPMCKINEIMARFAQVGPQAHVKPIKAAGEAAPDEEEKSGELPPIDDDAEDGEVPAKEFEYLLGMPMWSVTEERVDQLIRLMNERKMEQ